MNPKDRILSNIRSIESALSELSYDEIKRQFLDTIKYSRSIQYDKELDQHLAKRFFMAVALLDVPPSEMDTIWGHLSSTGFTSDYSKLACLEIYLIWCERVEHVDQAIIELQVAEDLFNNSKELQELENRTKERQRLDEIGSRLLAMKQR